MLCTRSRRPGLPRPSAPSSPLRNPAAPQMLRGHAVRSGYSLARLDCSEHTSLARMEVRGKVFFGRGGGGVFWDQRTEMLRKTPERAEEWVRRREQSQENRMMSVQQTDALQCLGQRFRARESLSRILLLSRRAKSSFFPPLTFFNTSCYLLCFIFCDMWIFYGHR